MAKTSLASHTVTWKPRNLAAVASAAVKSTAPKMSMRGAGAKASMNTSTTVSAGLAPGAVVATVGAAGHQLAERIPAHDPVQVLVAEGADRLPVGPDQELLADARAIDDRGQGHGPVVLERVAELVVEAHRHQSIGSMKRWTVPPQVSPTANASSSE